MATLCLDPRSARVTIRAAGSTVTYVQKATSSPTGVKRRSRATRASIDLIQASLQIVAQSANQVRAHEQLLRAAGVRLDRAGAALLYKLRLHGGDSFRVTSLAALLGVDAPTVTRKVQQLERLGYVARAADPDDRRASRIHLTQSGEATLDRILVAHRERLERLFEHWADDDVRAFATLLERFSDSILTDMEHNDDH